MARSETERVKLDFGKRVSFWEEQDRINRALLPRIVALAATNEEIAQRQAEMAKQLKTLEKKMDTDSKNVSLSPLWIVVSILAVFQAIVLTLIFIL